MAVLLDAVKDVALIEFDIAKTEIGPPTAKKLAEVLSDATPFTASIVTINISQSKIGVEGGQAIVEALKTTTLESIVIGNDLTLQLKGELESDSFDASGQSIDPGYAMIMAWWLTTPVTGSLTKVVITGAEISETDVATLRAAAPNGCEVVW